MDQRCRSTLCLVSERHDLNLGHTLRNREHRDSGLNVEPSRSRSTGIHHQLPLEPHDQRSVRMAIDDHISVVPRYKPLRRRNAQFVPVTHMNAHPADLSVDRLRKAALTRHIAVPEHCLDGRNQLQLIQNLVPFHIARV